MQRRRAFVLLLTTALIVVCAITLGGKLVPAQEPAAGPGFGAPAELNPPPDLRPPGEGAAPQDAPAENNEDKNTEVLTRGAVHEAFAQPVVFDPKQPVVVAKQPPEPVEEIPPEQKPAGDHVVWVAGYWTYEQDQDRFIWTSGIWRAMPPAYEWVPGYWSKKDEGAQWVSGFWRHGETAEVNYLPQPPQTLEAGAVGTAPAADRVWIPGVWIWRGTHYGWRPGYWAACQPGWIWVPSYYVWTPSGHVFVEGHWDYELQKRGVIFAPVVFRPGAVVVGYSYTPAVVVDCNLFTGCLFCRPQCCCYCYGDYYGPEFVTAGYYPWFSFHMSRYGYDPCFAYYGWHEERFHPGWRDHLIVEYRFRRDHIEARPARTYAAMRIGGGGGGVSFAVSLNTMAGRRGGPMRFEHVSAVRRAEFRRSIHENRVANEHRVQMERSGAGRAGTGPQKMSIPKSNSLSSNANGGRAQAQGQVQGVRPQINSQRSTTGSRSGQPTRATKPPPRPMPRSTNRGRNDPR